MSIKTDFLIIGGGVMGLATARALKARFPAASIAIIEKEDHVAEHASGRNSGVLHAGFYYSADSLKARFCREGNAAWKAYAKEHGLRLNECGKVVVAVDEEDRQMLHELMRRGEANNVALELIDTKRLAEIEPNAKSFEQAIYCPSSAVVDPREMCGHLARTLFDQGVMLLTSHPYIRRISGNSVQAGKETISAGKIINCAGVYADKIAQDFGHSRNFTIIPFKGIYLSWRGTAQPLKRLVYGVPNLANPFLGVHFGIRVDGTTRLGPTAIPAFWRENYRGMENFNVAEAAQIAGWEAKLFATNAFNFRALAFKEMRKYMRSHMTAIAGKMVQGFDMRQFCVWDRPGIRAQLLDTRSLQLVQDFVVEGDKDTVHVLNAVSPAFTCSLPFAQWMADNHV